MFDQVAAGTYAGVLAGTGSLTKTGAGTLTLTGRQYLLRRNQIQRWHRSRSRVMRGSAPVR